MATQFTASEHLNDPGHLSEEYVYSLIVWNGIRNHIILEKNVIQA